MNILCDRIWEDILSKAKKWQENATELKTLGKGKKATIFTITEVAPDYLTISVYHNKYSKDLFCSALKLLYERGKEGAELRPIKTSHPIIGTIDYAVRPRNIKGKVLLYIGLYTRLSLSNRSTPSSPSSFFSGLSSDRKKIERF